MGFRFHAAPRSGHWINDPNALVYEGERYRLYAQHCPQPGFGPMGWGQWTSADLIDWHWDGIAFAPTDTHSVFSGSMTRGPDGTLDLYYTLHDRTNRNESQHRNKGLAALQPGVPIGPQGRDCRDPFVFFCPATHDWRMLVAHPCSMEDWPSIPPSFLSVWASHDREAWHEAARIGPWHPAGVMWEVPALIDFGVVQALIVSLVDLRHGKRDCTVRYWLGRLDDTGFKRDPAFPADGLVLDHGPDFYAAIPNVPGSWPEGERILIAWASSWETASIMPWPAGVHGGPMTLPRRVVLQDGTLMQAPVAAIAGLPTAHLRWTPGSATHLEINGEAVSFTLNIAADGAVVATRDSQIPQLCWHSDGQLRLSIETDIQVLIDAGLVEFFFLAKGLTLTAFVPGADRIA